MADYSSLFRPQPFDVKAQGPTVDFYSMLTGIGNNLKDVIKDNRISSAFSGGLPRNPDGTINWRDTTDRVLQSGGNINDAISIARLEVDQNKIEAANRASREFGLTLGGIYGGQLGTQPQPPAAPQSRPPVPSSNRAWGDTEAVNAGLYDRPGQPGVPPAAQPGGAAATGNIPLPRPRPEIPIGTPFSDLADPNAMRRGAMLQPPPTAPLQPPAAASSAPMVPRPVPTQSIPRPQAAPPQSASTPTLAGVPLTRTIPALIAASTNPNLPAPAREMAGKMLQAALEEAKQPNDVKEYNFARSQGETRSYSQWKTDMKKSGAANVSVDTRGENEYAKVAGKQFAELNVEMIKGGQSARQKIFALERLNTLLSSPGIYTGVGGETVTDLKRAAKAVGLDIEGVPAAEAARALSNQFSLELRNPSGGAGMPGAMSDKDREFLQAQVPGLSKSPEGNKILVDYMKRLAQRTIDVDRQRATYVRKNGKLDEGFYRELDEWSSKNPLFPEADRGIQPGMEQGLQGLGQRRLLEEEARRRGLIR